MSIERRLMSGTVEVEERADGTPKIRGVAAVYNSESNDLGGFREIIEPGAFDHLIDQRRKDAAEVVALWNHDSSQLLGRTSAKTLRLWSDEHGLHYEIDPVPNTSLGRDLIEHIKLGNVRGSSFAFTVDSAGQRVDEDKETGKITRYITRATGLFDVSPVTRPAYDATAVKVRSLEEIRSMIPAETAVDLEREEPEAEGRQLPLTVADRLNIAKAQAVLVRCGGTRNCGIGSSGFTSGNTCAKGGSGKGFDGLASPTGQHSIALPKNPKRLNRDETEAALGAMGYKLGKSSWNGKETTFEITDSKGKTKKVTGKEIKKVVYGNHSNPDIAKLAPKR